MIRTKKVKIKKMICKIFKKQITNKKQKNNKMFKNKKIIMYKRY